MAGHSPQSAGVANASADDWRVERASGEKSRKACLTCRKQKMRCRPGHGESCQRCERAQIPCVFVPRSNAVNIQAITRLAEPSSLLNESNILRRLDRIESFLGLSEHTETPQENLYPEKEGEDLALAPLWATARVLAARHPDSSGEASWDRATITRVWQLFHQAMPGLHFMPEKQVFTAPKPLLLAAMLYCSASRGPADIAIYAPTYRASLRAEIAALLNPADDGWLPSASAATTDEETAFQNILGTILAVLLSEGVTPVTGLWISAAYRILTEQCPPCHTLASPQWQKMFSGLQIMDLEHCSLHLMCPTIPLQTSLNATRASDDQLFGLSRLMHVGLTHFSGRGLPTIWSYVSNNAQPHVHVELSPFTGVDAAVIRDWARQLDDWLAHFSVGPFEHAAERVAIYRQYVMHRLCVHSIYLPARHLNLFSAEATAKEQTELLESARTTIKLQSQDGSIWSNWDLIMITWAALIVLQAIKGNYGQQGDVNAIELHISLLRQTNEPQPNLREMLAVRLENEMVGVREDELPPPLPLVESDQSGVGYPWALFDESSLQAVDRWF